MIVLTHYKKSHKCSVNNFVAATAKEIVMAGFRRSIEMLYIKIILFSIFAQVLSSVSLNDKIYNEDLVDTYGNPLKRHVPDRHVELGANSNEEELEIHVPVLSKSTAHRDKELTTTPMKKLRKLTNKDNHLQKDHNNLDALNQYTRPQLTETQRIDEPLYVKGALADYDPEEIKMYRKSLKPAYEDTDEYEDASKVDENKKNNVRNKTGTEKQNAKHSRTTIMGPDLEDDSSYIF